jgi:hypothetical protein
VSPSADDPEAQSSIQSSGDGGQSIASRTKLRRARRRLPTIALPTDSSPLEQHSQTPIKNTDSNDPPLTPQLTNDNPLIGLPDRQRAHLKHSRRCLENHTRNDSSMSEILDEEVDYGSYGVNAFSLTNSDHAWSTYGNDSQD